MIDNVQFLQAIFGQDYTRAHVTSFDFDPSAIPVEKQGLCWHGHLFKDRPLKGLNQYFTVSLFNQTSRKKEFFEATYVVMLDDVKEKLDFEKAQELPEPSFILETSAGSEQWGYILKTPETLIDRVDNLHDGLLSRGLAPNTRDPGQKGVTRYVRLPEGKNNKKNKLVFGKPFNCKLLLWKPEQKYDIEEVAAPFEIDLNMPRKQAKLSGACDVDHPVLGHVKINVKNAPGEYDIECPWIDEHTSRSNSGTAVFTNEDLSLGFKCHHGHCEDRTAVDLIEHLDIMDEITEWKMQKALEKYTEPKEEKASTTDLLAALDKAIPGSSDQKNMAKDMLRISLEMETIDSIDLQKKVKDIMDWNAAQLKAVLKDLKEKPVEKESTFYEEYIFVGEQNKFFNIEKKIWYQTDAFHNMHFDDDVEAKKNALKGAVKKVDRIDYAPEGERFFSENGINYANIWRNKPIKRTAGDCSLWLNHFKLLGWDTDHMMKWMAFTLRHPAQKINHGLVLGSAEGSGKDWILEPLKRAMGEDHQTVDGDEILGDYSGYIKGTKYLHINEVELGDNKDAMRISNKIKPWLAAPPETIRVREMWAGAYDVRNIVNVSMSTNSRLPLRLREVSRRLYCLWTNFRTKDPVTGVTLPQWIRYWEAAWGWMEKGGWEKCVDHLMRIDLSEFNPGAAPPVTDWLRQMVSGSENTIIQTLRNVLAEPIFECGTATTAEILTQINVLRRLEAYKIFCDNPSNALIELNMRNLGYEKQGDNWILNNNQIRLATIN